MNELEEINDARRGVSRLGATAEVLLDVAREYEAVVNETHERLWTDDPRHVQAFLRKRQREIALDMVARLQEFER